MKAAPTQLALLMSAAGLGMSCPAWGAAPGDTGQYRSVHSEHLSWNCVTSADGGLMACRLSETVPAPGVDEASARHEVRTAAPPVTDGASLAYDPDAMAMVLMAAPPQPLGAVAAVAASPALRELQGPSTGSGVQGDAERAPPTQIGEGRGRPAAAQPVRGSETGSTELVLRDLADRVGSQREEPLRPRATEPIAATPEPDVPANAAAGLADARVSSLDSAHVGSHSCLAGRLDADKDIVVVTHTDRVLMSLQALLSDETPVLDRYAAQTRQTLVTSHSEKVLETLGTFKRKAPASVWDDDEPPMTAAEASAAPRTRRTEGADTHRTAQATPPKSVRAATPQSPFVGEQAVALSGNRLDEVRGGFVSDSGLKISFGIARAVYLNGELMTTTSLNVADLSKLSGGQAQVTTTGAGALALVQSGQGNTFLPGAITQTATGIVIQNSLDNKRIQAITQIDAVVHSSSIIRQMSLQSSMRSAVIDSLRR